MMNRLVMNKLKRIVSAAAAAVMVTAAWVTVPSIDRVSAADAEKSEKAYALELMGVMSAKDNSVYEQTISRGDFAYYLGKMLKRSSDDSQKRYFSDVTDYDYATPYINALVEMGVISVGDDRKFNPSDDITSDEAVKMVVSALGYGPLAKVRGGYPLGYMRIARDGNLLDGVDFESGEAITLNCAMNLMFNALLEPQYVLNEIQGDEQTYIKSEDSTLIGELYGMDYAHGVLTGANGVNIKFDTDVTADENSIVADGVKCEIDGETEYYADILGKGVYVLFDDETDKVFHIFEDTEYNTEETVIDIKDFVKYTSGSIEYYQNNKARSINVSNAIVLYNNAVPQKNLSQLFDNLTCGSIRALKTDGGAYDVVMIYDCKPFVLKYADTTSEALYSLSDDTVIKLKEYENVRITDESGKLCDVEDLAAKSVMNVYAAADKERINIKVTQNSVEGVLGGMNAGEREITVNSAVYETEKGFEALFNALSVGSTIRVYLDEFGKVIYAKVTDGEGMVIGYLIGAKCESDVFDSGLIFKLYTSDSKLLTLDGADNISIDGKSFRGSAKSALAAIPGGGNQTQIIRYALNSDGKIRKIDTYEQGEEDEDATLKRVKDGSSASVKYSYRINKDLVLSADTLFFCVPQDDVVRGASVGDFSIVKQGRFNNGVNFKFECYKAKGENEFADAIVYRVNPDDTKGNDYLNSNMFLISEIAEAVDADNETYTQIKGMLLGRDETLKVYDDKLLSSAVSVGTLAEGDLIRYRTDYNGAVMDIQLLYDESEGRRIGWGNDTDRYSMFDPSYTSYFNLSFGYVSERGDSTIGWGYKSGTQTDERISAGSTTFMFYDKNSRDKKVYLGNFDDIRDYESAGDECDIIIAQFSDANIRTAVIYKR